MSHENVKIMRSRGQLPISDRQLRRLLRYPGAMALIFRLVVLVPARWWSRRNVAISEAMMCPPDTNAAALMRDGALSSWSCGDKQWGCIGSSEHRSGGQLGLAGMRPMCRMPR